MASKLFISAKEVAKELEVSKESYAYRLIRELNAQLGAKRFRCLMKGKMTVNLLKNEFTV